MPVLVLFVQARQQASINVAAFLRHWHSQAAIIVHLHISSLIIYYFSTQIPNTSFSAAIGLAFHHKAADELGGDDLGGAAKEGVGEVLGGRGGYGGGFVRLC